MKSAARGHSRTTLGLPLWRALTWAVLLAFAVQSYVTQTHLHGVGPETAGIAGSLLKSSGQGKLPSDNQLADCPFCQAIAHSGVFFAPAAPVLVLPVWQIHAAPLIAGHEVNDVAARHSWQSRGPPQP